MGIDLRFLPNGFLGTSFRKIEKSYYRGIQPLQFLVNIVTHKIMKSSILPTNVKAQAPAPKCADGTANGQAEDGLPDAPCSASSIRNFLSSLSKAIGPQMERYGVGKVEYSGGDTLLMAFGHCRIGVHVSGETPYLEAVTMDFGLLSSERVRETEKVIFPNEIDGVR